MSDQYQGLKLPVVEIFTSIQGEGFHTGRASIFVRLAGCDLACNWCDSKDSWNACQWPEVDLKTLVSEVLSYDIQSVIVTGGEPLTHNLAPLCRILKKNGYSTYLETSGSHPLTGEWDWICLSPKHQAPPIDLFYPLANELKVVIEDEKDLIRAERWGEMVTHPCVKYLQPEWSKRNTVIPLLVQHILKHPQWLLSLQSHKYIGIP